jgi:KDO2-lipid IV(A) lauroyltransferase
MGNWDLAGAFACRNLEPVITVAEHLEPERVFQDFLAMRQALGMTIIPLEKNQGTFRQLSYAAKKDGTWLVPLLADRDLGRHGVEVDLFGERALVAAGPAALAVARGLPVIPLAMFREGKRYAMRFLEPVWAPSGMDTVGQIQAVTQGWVTALEGEIRKHPADWHMLQKVFVADLDPERLAQVRGEAP